MSNRFQTLISFSTGGDGAYYSAGVYTSAMLFEMFLFGLYVALFGSCIHILLRNKRSLQKSILVAIVIMFLLATADVVWGILNMHLFILKKTTHVQTRDDDDDDSGKPEIPIKILQYKFLLYITSNIVADLLLIYRCYTLWNNSKRIIALPCLVLLNGTICGYLFVGMSDDEYPFRFLLNIFLFSTLALNSVLTSLMAGRIWWMARRTRGLFGPTQLTKKYRTAIAIFIESGLIYSIYVILDVVLHVLLLDSGLVQIVGLVPTLMIVQIGMSQDRSNVHMTTTNNLTTHKDGTSMSLNNFDSQHVSECAYDPNSQGDRIRTSAPVASPIIIPAPPYRTDSVERFRTRYPASPSSDETRVGDLP